MAEKSDAPVSCTDLPVKRPREDEENGVSASAMETEGDNNNTSNNVEETHGISSVIPGWFSEISPMWPGAFFNSPNPHFFLPLFSLRS